MMSEYGEMNRENGHVYKKSVRDFWILAVWAEAGRECLVKSENVRRSDVIARFGGDRGLLLFLNV